MKDVVLTLTLPIPDAKLVLAYIETLSVAPTASVTVKQKEEVVTPQPTKEEPVTVVTHPTAGKTVKMPGLGRTQSQIKTFEANEENRVEALTEEEELREQRREERAAKKAIKDQELEEKRLEEVKAQEEVDNIKEAVEDHPVLETEIKKVPKPWEL